MYLRVTDVAKNKSSHNTRAGFSFLELSIVIVIIGLLLSAVLIGKDSIRQAKLRRFVSQTEEFSNAIKQFKDKYGDLPGDMWNATAIWGTDPDGCPASVNATPKTETCNGNGNGRVYDYPAGADAAEVFRAFQQLSNAEMIRGSFTGSKTLAGVADSVTMDLNVPACDLGGAALWLQYYGLNDNTDPLYFPMRGHFLSCGMLNGSRQVLNPVMSPFEARTMDTKIDDGRPGTGRMTVLKSACATSTDPDTAIYSNNDTVYACLVFFGMDDTR